MNTTNYINHFQTQELSKYDQSLSKAEKVQFWVHKNSKLVKTIEVATILFGVVAIASAPFSWPVIAGGAVALAVIGGLVATISAVALKFLDIALSPHHDMKNHTFKTGSYGVGKLYYQGDVPILELQSDDSYKAGEAHGFLLAPYLSKMYQRLQFVSKLGHMPTASQLPNVLENIKKTIPEAYLKEMQGMVDGYNKWGQSKFIKEKKITLDDLLLFHLMPDQTHFNPKLHESMLKNQAPDTSAQPNNILPVVGCTVVIDRDEKEGLTFGRNMDWPSFGIFGSHTIGINRKYKDGRLSTFEIGIIGMSGTLTGMNEKGLSISMNVCSNNTKRIEGMPALFYNRMCLESCQNVDEVEARVKEQAPLGAYHLSTADANQARSFHFFQGATKKHTIRHWAKENPLVVTNCNYANENLKYSPMHRSSERHDIIDRLFQKAQKEITKDQMRRAQLVEASLALPYVNNSLSAHCVVMNPLHRRIKVAFDHAFVGTAPLHELDTSIFFN